MRRHLHDSIAHLVDAPLPAEEFLARINAPLTDQEREETLELVRWFTRRYPTVQERMAYVRRKYREWNRPPIA